MVEPSNTADGTRVAAASADGVGVILGAEYGFVNDRLAEIHGYDRTSALVGREWADVYELVEQEYTASEMLERVREAGDWEGTAVGCTRNGSRIPVDLSMLATDEGIVCVVREHTAEYGPESERQRIDDEYRQLVDTAPVPIGVFTAGRGFVYCNLTAVEFLGADDRGDVVGCDPGAFVRREDRERLRRRIDRVLDDRRATEPVACRLRGLDGRERVAEIATVPVVYEGTPAALAILNDVTEYQRSLKHLRKERQFVENVFDALDDVLYVVDERDRLVTWNDRLNERLGYSDAELAAMRPSEFLSEERRVSLGTTETNAVEQSERARHVELVTSDGERIPHELRSVTHTDAVGDRYRVAVARDVTARAQREQELERYKTIVETVDDGVYALDERLQFDFVNDALCEMVGLSRETLLGTPVLELFTYEDEMALAREVRERALAGDTSTGTIEGTYERDDGETIYTEARFRLHPAPDDGFAGSVGVVRDVTDRRERERRLERQRDELDTLNRINGLLFEVVRELFESSSLQGIEQTVCERLVDSQFYQFAWIGEPAAGGRRLVPRASAGPDGDAVEPIAVTTGEGATGRGPVGLAFHTGNLQVSQDITLDSVFEQTRDLETDRDVRSAAAVPLFHDDTVFGVLVVSTSRPLGFGQRERRGLESLGEAIGFAIDAGNTRRLLYAEAVSELEFVLGDSETVLCGAVDELDCTVRLDGYVTTGDGNWVLYLSVDGDAAGRFVDAAAADDRVLTVRLIDGDGDESLVGLLTESSLLDTIATAGGKVTAATLTPRMRRVTVEVPQSTDVRRLVQHVRSIYPDATFVSRTNHERPPEDALWLSDDRCLDLTDRQHQALEAAFRAGYFSWPRESTAQDVADLLGIAAPTLHAHLRKAERKLLSVYFETVDSHERRP